MKHISKLLSTLVLAMMVQGAIAQSTPDGNSGQMQGFGQAVDISNGNVFIGEPSNVHLPGVVYIFTKEDGEWSQKFMIKAEDGVIGDGFGQAVSAHSNSLLVGAPNKNDDEGGAYLFQQNADGLWAQIASLTVQADSAYSAAGSSVALGNDFAFVGVPELGHGAVAVFKADGNNWMQQHIIMNTDTSETGFGSELDFDGTNLLVGATNRDGGSAYVYAMNDTNEWALTGTLKSSSLTERAAFGSSVAIKNDVALVGAFRQDGIGQVFVYRKSDNGWMADGRLSAFDSKSRMSFGYAIDFIDNEVWVTAVNSDGTMGSLYRFMMNEDGTFNSSAKLKNVGQKPGDYFGYSLAIDGGITVSGLFGADHRAGAAAIIEQNDMNEWEAAKIVISEPTNMLTSITDGKVDCEGGAASLFGCENVNLISFLPNREIGGERGVNLNDIWGWEDPETGKEYALVGRTEGTSFVDISDPSNPVYVANLPMTDGARANAWRDIKVYKNHAYIVADGAGPHGMQVVDLTRLREYDGEPMLLDTDAHYDNIDSAHNVVINEDTGFAYIVGASGGGMTCGGGLHMVNIQDPKTPEFAGCFADPSTGRSGTGYSHDAQCVIYNGPDEEHKGKEICVGANETAISIADVTDKENPIALSTGSYPDYGYVHQGWFTENHQYFFQNDELDELMGTVEQTRTIVWDLTDLDDPQVLTQYFNDNASSDHNLYIKDNIMYASNYVSGLQVIDVSDPANPTRVGFFDTFPFMKDAAGFNGTWSNYPYFKSGVIVMTSGTEGLFILETSPVINK